MAGLFDFGGEGGFNLDALMGMLGPGAAQAGTMPPPPSFDDRFGASFDKNAPLSPTNVPPGMITPTINPQVGEPSPSATVPGQEPTRLFGSTFAGPPPPMGNGAGLPLPMARPPTAPVDVGAALAAPIPGATGPTSLGGEAGPAPLAAPSGESGSTDVGARAKTEEEKRPSLAQALKGVQAPKAPELQKIATPNAPRATGTIKSGDLQALLMALNAGAPALGGRQLPVTLGRG
jgi:hypothetical protein